MLTFNQLQEKKTKIKINPKVQDQYEGKKSDGIELVDGGEKVARGAQKRAEQLGAKRRQASYKKYGANVGSPGKNERAGYNLSRAARSAESSPETQRTKKKRPAGEDTSQIGHSRKAQEKTDTGKSGKKLKTPKYKLTFKQRQQHHSNYAHSRRDPKQNPKHTANEEFVFTEEFITERVDFAVNYFFNEGINEDGLDLIIEEVGLDTFLDFVLDQPQELNEDEAAYQKAKKKEEEEDPRSMGTKYRNMKNKLRAMGLQMSHDPEGESIEESEKVARGAQKRAEQLGAKRRQASYKK